MKITIRGFLTLREVMGDQSTLELEIGNLTLMELLNELSDMFGERFSEMIFDKAGKGPNEHIRILINGRHYSHIPQKLDTRLQAGDEVALFPPIAGG
ncbi:MAG: MoaD family protein [Desulfobacterales bacterium]|jgi:molybdopterin synthase sulfur carrier subunit